MGRPSHTIVQFDRKRRNIVGNSEERFRALLEKIDPSIRKARLEKEREDREQQFLGLHSDLQSQRRLVERHRAALKQGTPESAAVLVQAEENLRQLELITEHIAGELEAVQEQLAEMQVAGLPKKGESE